MTGFEWSLPPVNYSELTQKEKFNDVVVRMEKINNYMTMKFWRARYATPDQFEEEYPEGHERQLKMAFEVLKMNYIENEDAWYKSDNEYMQILKKIIEQDVEQILLGDGDYNAGVEDD